MTKLEEAEEMLEAICDDTPGWPRQLSKEEAKAVADELDRLRGTADRQNKLISDLGNFIAKERGTAFLHTDTSPTIEAVTWIGELRAELAALKGEAERTAYVAADDATGAVKSAPWWPTVDAAKYVQGIVGAHIYAVRISARKVQP